MLIERFKGEAQPVAGAISTIYATLGQTGEAFTWLDVARRRNDLEMGYLKVEPRWDPLRADPRFVAYLAVEAYGLMSWYGEAQVVRRETLRYRDLARNIARAFVPGNATIGTWDYYEAMEKHLESGVFDRSPGGTRKLFIGAAHSSMGVRA